MRVIVRAGVSTKSRMRMGGKDIVADRPLGVLKQTLKESISVRDLKRNRQRDTH